MRWKNGLFHPKCRKITLKEKYTKEGSTTYGFMMESW